MIKTQYGTHDGNTWEYLCQQAFKLKYGEDGYQEMASSPGDYGIEGFTKKTGLAFQCYCPEKKYTQVELYEKQRDKITNDLDKLKKYEFNLAARLGDTKIKQWVFVTPEINNNKLLEHAEKKQNEIKLKNISILDEDFTVLIKDGDFFSSEFIKINQINGEKLVFFDNQSDLHLDYDEDELTDYEKNIERKNKVRCGYDDNKNDSKLNKLNELTVKLWLEGEPTLKNIEKNAPKIYYHLVRIISQYEDEVSELSLSWQADANTLVEKVKNGLFERIKQELPDISGTDQRAISNHMVSKWIALCPLDFE